MKAFIAALVATTLASAPLSASAAHGGGGGHGSGGFHGGGGHSFAVGRGGDFRGRGFRDGRGDSLLFDADFGFGFGWGFYDPWDYGNFPGYYPNDYGAGYDPAAIPPPRPGPDVAVGPASAPQTSQCGNWHWDADTQKYRWVTEAC